MRGRPTRQLDVRVASRPLSTETRVRPKLLTDLPPEMAKLIEDVVIDSKGRAVPKLYSKAWANGELRKMLNISAKEAPKDITQLSDQELLRHWRSKPVN